MADSPTRICVFNIVILLALQTHLPVSHQPNFYLEGSGSLVLSVLLSSGSKRNYAVPVSATTSFKLLLPTLTLILSLNLVPFAQS